MSTEGGLSAGAPTVVRDVGYAARFRAATRDHSKILMGVSPDAAKDKGEIQLLFGWQDALRQAVTGRRREGRGREAENGREIRPRW